jgi:hypothetical protein
LEFIDRTTELPITGLIASDFIVLNAFTSTNWNGVGGWTVQPLPTPGQYRLNISMVAINSGSYSIYINASQSPNHGMNQSSIIHFTILGNTTALGIRNFQDPSGAEYDLNANNRYEVFQNNVVSLAFNFTDSNMAGIKIPNAIGTQYWVKLNETYLSSGRYNFYFDTETVRYYGAIDLTGLSTGDFNLTIILGKPNYENGTHQFNITIKSKLAVKVEAIAVPTEFQAGNAYKLQFKASYYDVILLDWKPLVGKSLLLSTLPATEEKMATTDAEGVVEFTFTIPVDYDIAQKLKFTISFAGDFSLESMVISVPVDSEGFSVLPPETGLPFPIYYIYILIASLVLAVVVPVVQRKIIAPRKQRYTDLVMSSATIFDDAINLQHIMIIYKSTGTSLFFKSFGTEALDPDLISGFLSAVQSFGKELKSVKTLNELTYGDKMLLFSDGEFVRTTLVLSKPASPYMKRKLAEFVGRFEGQYQKRLQNWKGQLNIFKEAGDLVDEVLNTSVILPHEISKDSKIRKSVSSSLGNKLLSISQSLMTEERNFIFLAQLMGTAVDQTKKEPSEIIMALNELRDKKVLTPIKIESLEKQEMSDQEIRTLAERVAAIPNKNDAEKKDILMQLIDMPAAEREVALGSLTQSMKITTSFSGATVETKKFENVKDAKKELGRLDGEAKKALKNKDPDEAIRNFEIAEVIAYQWNLDTMGAKYGNLVLSTTVNKYRHTIDTAKKAGPKLEKAGQPDKAIEEYDKAIGAAHQLFKLGFVEVDLEIKELSRKMSECEKKAGKAEQKKDYFSKENLYACQKQVQGKLKDAQKAKDFLAQNENTTKLLVIANHLFQFGLVQESENVKKFRNGLDDIKKKIAELSEDAIQQISGQVQDLNGKKGQLLDFAKDSEDKQDWVNALAAYQQVMTVYYKMGDVDNALNLSNKIKDVSQKVPDLIKTIQDFKAEGEKLKKAGDEQGSMMQSQYAQALADAIFYPIKK